MRKALVFSLLFVSLAIPAGAATCSDRAYYVFIECSRLAKQFKSMKAEPDLYSDWERKSVIKSSAKCGAFYENQIRFEACFNRMLREGIPDDLMPMIE